MKQTKTSATESVMPSTANGEKTRYLIIGTGGVGGSIAGFLALAGYNVTCIARGAHLEAIREKGLKLDSTLKGTHYIPVKACTAEEYEEKADVIFVCVKGYSLNSVTDLIRKASHKDTLVIPVLNVYGTGPKIKKLVGDVTVLDGCIYIVSYVASPGEVHQMGKIFRIVYGAHKSEQVSTERLETIRQHLVDSGIKAEISDDIDRDTFIKWSYISAMACTGAYFDAPMRELQQEGIPRETFANLSKESLKIGLRLNINLPEDLVEYNLKVLDKLDPESTASMQKDIAKGGDSEINGLLFGMIEKAEETGVEVPAYRMIAEKFQPLKS